MADFSRVEPAFLANFADELELGAALCIYHKGVKVVSLWAGKQGDVPPASEKLWQEDTLTNVYSVTKAWAAVCMQLLVQRGKLELDAPVSRYWPEFAQAGKGETTVRQLLSHRSGLAAVRETVDPKEWNNTALFVDLLAKQEPYWKAGDGPHGYHAYTSGWLWAELLRRVDGRSMGRFWREEIADRFKLDMWIGTPEELHPRIAPLVWPAPVPGALNPFASMFEQRESSFAARAFCNPIPVADMVNSREWRLAEHPGANGHCSAEALAKFYSLLVEDALGKNETPNILTVETVERLRHEESAGVDRVMCAPECPLGPRVITRLGLGVFLPVRTSPFSPNERAFGHSGVSGSLGFCDPENELAIGYVVNRSGGTRVGTLNQRWLRWLPEVYAAIGLTLPAELPGAVMPPSYEQAAAAQ